VLAPRLRVGRNIWLLILATKMRTLLAVRIPHNRVRISRSVARLLFVDLFLGQAYRMAEIASYEFCLLKSKAVHAPGVNHLVRAQVLS